MTWFLIEQKQTVLHVTTRESLDILMKLWIVCHSGTVRGTEVSSSGNALLECICQWMPSGPLQNKPCYTSEMSVVLPKNMAADRMGQYKLGKEPIRCTDYSRISFSRGDPL